MDKKQSQEIITIDPLLCRRWEFADRSGFEFGNLYELGEDIRKNGQIEPVHIRKINHDKYKYEVIAGSRRWKACLEASIPLKAIIVTCSDSQAIKIQIEENKKLAISDYSKGISYGKMIESNKLTQKKLATICGFSEGKLAGFLSFTKIPEDIIDAIGNLSKVTARSAREILLLSDKGKIYQEALAEIAPQIREGAGARRIKNLVNTIVASKSKNSSKVDDTGIVLKGGTVIANWKNDNNIVFDKNIKINKKAISKLLIKYFDKQENGDNYNE